MEEVKIFKSISNENLVAGRKMRARMVGENQITFYGYYVREGLLVKEDEKWTLAGICHVRQMEFSGLDRMLYEKWIEKCVKDAVKALNAFDSYESYLSSL